MQHREMRAFLLGAGTLDRAHLAHRLLRMELKQKRRRLFASFSG
jgi:hypothetical protein